MAIIVCNILSLIGLVGFCVSNFCKSKKNILSVQLICNITDILIYIISGGMTGLASAIANFIRNTVFVKFNNKTVVVLCSTIKVLLLVINYENVVSLVFIILEIIATVLILYGSTQQFRVLTLVREGTWVVYDYITVSLIVTLTTVIKFCFCLTAVTVNRKSKLVKDSEMES